MDKKSKKIVLGIGLNSLLDDSNNKTDSIIENKITRPTGIKAMVNMVSEGLNIPCGCESRKEALNRMIPFKRK